MRSRHGYATGELWWAELSPAKGSEQSGKRPVVIISGKTLNDHLPIVIACPLTTKLKESSGRVSIRASRQTGLTESSEVLVFQIRALAKERLNKRIGSIDSQTLREIKRTLLEVLTY